MEDTSRRGLWNLFAESRPASQTAPVWIVVTIRSDGCLHLKPVGVFFSVGILFGNLNALAMGYYRYMLTKIRDRIQDMVERDMTLEEVKATPPTLDYDARQPWTPFIEAVYRGVGTSE